MSGRIWKDDEKETCILIKNAGIGYVLGKPHGLNA